MLDIKLIFDIKDIDQLGNLPRKKKKKNKHACCTTNLRHWPTVRLPNLLLNRCCSPSIEVIQNTTSPPPQNTKKKKEKKRKKEANSLNKCIAGIFFPVEK